MRNNSYDTDETDHGVAGQVDGQGDADPLHLSSEQTKLTNSTFLLNLEVRG